MSYSALMSVIKYLEDNGHKYIIKDYQHVYDCASIEIDGVYTPIIGDDYTLPCEILRYIYANMSYTTDSYKKQIYVGNYRIKFYRDSVIIQSCVGTHICLFEEFIDFARKTFYEHFKTNGDSIKVAIREKQFNEV